MAQQCSYPVEKYIIEKKTERFLHSDILAEFIAINIFHDLKAVDAVSAAISNKFIK